MKSIYKKKVHLLLLAVLCLTVLLFIPQKVQAAAVKKPSQVKNLTVKLTAKRAAKLTWKKAAHAKKYQVYCSVNGGKYKKLKTTKAASVTHKKLKTGAVYVYKVRGINQGKKGSYSSVQRIRTLADTKPGLSAAVTGTTAVLEWNKVKNAIGYYLYKAGANGKWNKITAVKERSYVVNGLELGGVYSYKVVPYLSANGKTFKGSSSVKKITMPASGWLLDYVQPYAKPLSYESYNARAFTMRGTYYTHGFAVRGTLRNDEGIYFNLGGKYASLTFKTGMKDGKYTARKPAKVTIKADGKNIENGIFEIKDDEAFSIHTINVKGCKDLRICIVPEDIIKLPDTEYGFADVKLSK